MDIRRRSLLSEILQGDGSSEEPINIDNYLTIEALENGLTASLSTNACEYCVDGDGNWKTLAADTATESINSGQTLSFRGNLTPVPNTGVGTFTISKKCNLKGSCMSMLFGDNAADNYSLSGKNYAFYKLFYSCKNIVNVSSDFLHVTTLESSCYGSMFYGCTSLTTAPELPATTLSNWCYSYMFYGCSALTTAPELPATTLANYCYSYMLSVTNLVNAPELPATTLADYCYNSMFRDCKKLTTAPELPATTLTNSCYNSMFYGCISLTTAPALPATTLAYTCYYSMFQNCTNLTVAPALPATALDTYCYRFMFCRCTSLTTAPELPATTLAALGCYEYMFLDCSNLNYIKMLATDISANYCLDSWVKGVASSGTFVKNPAMNSLPTGDSGIPSGWTVVSYEEQMNTDNYLTIEALEDGLTASLSVNTCEYCVDGDDNWKTLSAGDVTESINTGQTLSFRGNLTPNSSNGIGTFTISKKCNLKGNCMSMLFGDSAASNYSLSGKDFAFHNLFNGCTNIINVSSNFLPATTLASACYNYMFCSCSSLTTAPELPATTLTSGCYESMFHNCSSLTTAPELPATTLANSCYYYMFCRCTSLTTAPELPATTLTSYCYYYMFYGCKKLNYIKMLATDISASNCLSSWVSVVASTGTFVKHPDMTTLPTGISGIPSGWTVVNDGEESEDIIFPVYLITGDNGEIGKSFFQYCIEKMVNLGMTPSFNTFISFSDAEEVYVTAQDGSNEEDYKCNQIYIPTTESFRLNGHLGYWYVYLNKDGILSANYD